MDLRDRFPQTGGPGATTMGSHHFDAVVVGAGPTGSNTARLLALRGHSVLLLEEHPTVGIPVQCAGLVTPRTFDHTPFPIGDLWQNDLTGARIVAPDGTAIEFDGKAVHAQAMDRARFDQRMAYHAVKAGATLWTGAKATAAVRDSLGVNLRVAVGASGGGAKGLAPGQGGPAGADDASRGEVATQSPGPAGEHTVRCRLLVGADGIRSSVARWFDFPAVREIVSCYEAELAGCTIDGPKPHIIPMFAGHAQAPGFFSWIIPVGRDAAGQANGRARAGLAVAPGMGEASAKALYERMFEDPQSAPYLRGAQPQYLIIGGIPLGLRDALVQDRVALVGDAAGMAKPTSGGGIYYGLVASELLVDVASPALQRDRLSSGDLAVYERRVRRTLGRELRKGERLRAVYKRFADADFNRLARLLATPKARAVIERVGDIDYPSRLVVPLALAQPRLVPFFLRIMMR